jgi:hypothetical protein
MRQPFLPGFPEGAEQVSYSLRILRKDGIVTYFLDGDSYFSHAKGDKSSERFALTSLMINGHVRPSELEREPLSLAHRTLMNWTKQYREEGPDSFFKTKSDQHKPRVMTDDKVIECTALLTAGHCPAVVARLAGVGESTLRKAIARRRAP